MGAMGSMRRQLIVDPKWQFHVWRLTAGAAIGAGILYLMVGLAAVLWFPLESMSGSDIALVALAMNLTFFAFMAALLWVVSLRLTHAVAGPATLLKRAIDGLRVGEYQHRCQLRENDYLKELASAIGQLQAQMAQQAARDRKLRGTPQTALESAELVGARGDSASAQPGASI